jgi:hypothetical protein
MPVKAEYPITTLTCALLYEHAQRDSKLEIEDDLFIALECPYARVVGTSGEIVWPDRNSRNSREVKKNLLALFSSVAGAAPEKRKSLYLGQILCGMERASCWRRLLVKEDSAYLLAVGLIGYVEDYVRTYQMDVAVAPHICLLLNAWLKPIVPWGQPPSIGVLCEHMFGDVWTSLVLPGDYWEALGATYSDQGLAINLIFNDRPPFLPGLCPAQEVRLNVPLPGDVGFDT